MKEKSILKSAWKSQYIFLLLGCSALTTDRQIFENICLKWVHEMIVFFSRNRSLPNDVKSNLWGFNLIYKDKPTHQVSLTTWIRYSLYYCRNSYDKSMNYAQWVSKPDFYNNSSYLDNTQCSLTLLVSQPRKQPFTLSLPLP